MTQGPPKVSVQEELNEVLHWIVYLLILLLQVAVYY